MNKQERLRKMYEHLRYSGLIHTQRDLAEAIGAGAPTVSGALNGAKSCLTDSLLRRINEAFGFPFNDRWMLTGEGEMMASEPPLQDASKRQRVKMLDALVGYYAQGDKARFASMLGVSTQVVNAWYVKGAFDAELVHDKCDGVSGDWLLSGKGDMIRSEQQSVGMPSAWDSFLDLLADELRKRM